MLHPDNLSNNRKEKEKNKRSVLADFRAAQINNEGIDTDVLCPFES